MRNGGKAVLAALGLASLTACGGGAGGGSSMSIGNMLLTGGISDVPAQQPVVGDAYCPMVSVIEGGAAIQAGGRAGVPDAMRGQISLGNLARECQAQADGSVLVKVGVEGRALEGAAGGIGRANVPVRIVVKSGSTVFADRVRTAVVAIPAGQTQAVFAVVEDGIVVPPSAAENYEIEVGLGGAAARPARKRRG
jgi:hypothetical protein